MNRGRIRFVGGPKHNEVLAVELLPYIDVVVPPKVELTAFPVGPPSLRDCVYWRETYRLMHFVSEGGTHYSQYVHESLIRNGEPRRHTYCEELPTKDFDPSPLLFLRYRLRLSPS